MDYTTLVVDDDEALCGLLAYRLERIGYRVLQENDGHSAINTLKTEGIDVLVLDLMIPGIDGFRILSMMASGEVPSPGAVIVLSARAEEEDMLKAFEMGAIDYVTKPFSMNVLMARIEVAVKHKSR